MKKRTSKRETPSTPPQVAEKTFAHFQQLSQQLSREDYWRAAEELSACLEGVFMEREEFLREEFGRDT